MLDATTRTFLDQVDQHLTFLYPDEDSQQLASDVLEVVRPFVSLRRDVAPASDTLWSEADCLLITYGDSVVSRDAPPLRTLKQFLDRWCRDAISSVHILPFCPFSSDDGFSVVDYEHIRDDLGDWDDVQSIAGSYRLMVDLVINHISSSSQWFQGYCAGDPRWANFFIETKVEDDLSRVVRPRATPLLRATQTSDGMKQIWCTFSHDQVDVNFLNPCVLLEYLQIICGYLQRGAKIIRLDAIGYLWKETGTSCIHLPQTHEVVRLLRTVCDYVSPGTMLITETNVPNHENLSYFGNRNEAHAIYNFSLAPLLVHALLTGETGHLKRWMMSMPPAPHGCTYLNFTASHDGIGMRPAEGLLSDHEQSQLIETVRRHGGQFTTRRTSDGSEVVYELNVSLFDALKGTVEGPDDLQVERFVCSQTVMLGVEGIPAFYIHSLLATPNDEEAVKATGRSRSINRHRWDYEQLEQLLEDPASNQSQVMQELLRRIWIRSAQPAFHPNATQFTLQLGEPYFAFWRQSRDRSQSIFAVHNLTKKPQELRLSDLNLISVDRWSDLLSGASLVDLQSQLTIAPYQCLWLSNRPLV